MDHRVSLEDAKARCNWQYWVGAKTIRVKKGENQPESDLPD
jgi:hypothetical protein